ncbi:MAG: eukaryotic-like serine/threonine-protein kinase [Verrucomicrobiota bacterium]|jgi:serine/threonine protein kinase/tetratricopeptide (TPR) repeat protein
MKAERWQQINELFQSASERAPEKRAAFLQEACHGDESLSREVASLIAAYEQAEDFIESPAFEVAPELLTNERAGALVGESIAHYRIESLIGVGGMGEVYLAHDERLGRNVALKLLPQSLVADQVRLEGLKREARIASALNHPNIVTVYEIGEVDTAHYIATEFIDGTTLRERMAQGPIPPNEALEIAVQIASALSVAHAAGIVHRDIKPENIMLRPDGYVKVLDFGIAKFTEPETSLPAAQPTTLHGMIVGTTRYMSPEQARGLPVDARTDIWSLGVMLYEMVAGQPPFQGATATDLLIAIAGREPLPLTKCATEMPIQLERIVKKALAKDREQRHQAARDLLTDLKSVTPQLERPVMTSGRRRILVLAAVLGALILAGLFSARFLRRSSRPPPRPEIKSLAVLPMANLSGDPGQEYFADGMTETLIAGLARVSSLRVISRTSVMSYKGTHKSLPEIARELNVDAVVEGSVQRLGERVQVTVQLIYAPTDRHLWSETYDRDLRDILTLRNEVARAVTREIQIKLTPQEQTRLAGTRVIDPAAYDYFLRGRFHLSRQTKADNEKAIGMLDLAVATDPNFAAAHADLAQACIWRFFLFTPDEKQWEEKAFVAIEKALSLDPELAEAHHARGRLLWTPSHHFAHEMAIQEYRRAVALNPNLDEALHQLALVYGHVGLFEEARRQLEKVIAINPGNTLARYRTGETFLFQRDYEKALTVFRSVPMEVNPSLVGHQTAWALFNLGRKEEAAATLEQLLRNYPEDSGGLFTSLQAVLAASAGEERTAEEKIAAAIERGKGFGHFHHTAYFIGCAYALMSKPEPAMKWLEIAAEEGFPCYPLFEGDTNLDKLRQDARFVAFLGKLKQQWEHYRESL